MARQNMRLSEEEIKQQTTHFIIMFSFVPRSEEKKYRFDNLRRYWTALKINFEENYKKCHRKIVSLQVFVIFIFWLGTD